MSRAHWTRVKRQPMAFPAMNEGLRALLASLLAFDITSRASNLALIQFIDDYLTVRGVKTQWLHDDSGKKANHLTTLAWRPWFVGREAWRRDIKRMSLSVSNGWNVV